jgi:soluble lytic murein transglycosylase-like protein
LKLGGKSGTALVLAGAVGLAAGRLQGGERLLYVVQDGGIVFTNQETPGARPVPGFEARASSGRASTLPVTIYDPYIHLVAEANDLSPDLIKAVALVESGLDPDAVSHKGAQGLMQLMPQTARAYGVEDAFDPLDNLQAGARHLRELLDQFGGDLTLALAAYNAGAGAVRRHGGVPAFAETIEYVDRVHEKLGQARPARPAGRGDAVRPPRAPAGRPIEARRLSDGSLHFSN